MLVALLGTEFEEEVFCAFLIPSNGNIDRNTLRRVNSLRFILNSSLRVNCNFVDYKYTIFTIFL